jgi:hypothetical protein
MLNFLQIIKTVVQKKPHLFDKFKLNLLLSIFEQNEHQIVRNTEYLEIYLIIVNEIKGLLAYVHEEVTGHIISLIKSLNPYGVGPEKQRIARISCLVLNLAKNFKSAYPNEFCKKFLLKHVKNAVNDLRDGESDKNMEGLSFWLHKLVQQTETREIVIDMVVSRPQFLLKFNLKNVR